METALIKTESPQSIVPTLAALITKAAQVQGISKTASEVATIAATLYDYMLRDNYYKSLTGPEIAEIFRLGPIGRLGDHYGIAVATICKWMDEYYDTALEHRKAAEMAEKMKAREQTPKQIARETPEQALEMAITKAYRAYKRGEQVFDFGGCLKREIERREGHAIESLEDYFKNRG